jgi:spore maturation protein SpmB
VSTLQGTSETTFYVIAVYHSAVQVQRIRHTMVVALLADFVAVVASVAACLAYYRWNSPPLLIDFLVRPLLRYS